MRIVIGEDEALLRGGLRHLLSSAGMEVVADAGDAEELLAVTAACRPDIVITDIRMPPGNTDDGLRAAVAIRSSHPGTAVMVLSQHVQRQYATELLATGRGRVGYLLKQRIVDLDRFVDDVRSIAAGGLVLDREVVEAMMARAAASPASQALTRRQVEVLGLVAEGRSNAAIATRLDISERGVVQHLTNIYTQLGLHPDSDDHRRVLAVLHYLRSGAA